MENKTTVELLNELDKLTNNGHGDYNDEAVLVTEELKSRHIFFEIFGEGMETSLPDIYEKVDDVQEDVKKLKRHKHDEKTNDVLIRI